MSEEYSLQVGKVPPTQTQYPWRATLRTVVAAIVAAIPLVPILVSYLGIGSLPWVAGTVAVLGGITRLLAVPAVHDWVSDYLPWLAAEPPTTPEQLAELAQLADTATVTVYDPGQYPPPPTTRQRG